MLLCLDKFVIIYIEAQIFGQGARVTTSTMHKTFVNFALTFYALDYVTYSPKKKKKDYVTYLSFYHHSILTPVAHDNTRIALPIN